MESNTCETCKHFYQHYTKWGKGYHINAFGHCTYPRIKIRKSDTPACPHYKPREAQPCAPSTRSSK